MRHRPDIRGPRETTSLVMLVKASIGVPCDGRQFALKEPAIPRRRVDDQGNRLRVELRQTHQSQQLRKRNQPACHSTDGASTALRMPWGPGAAVIGFRIRSHSLLFSVL